MPLGPTTAAFPQETTIDEVALEAMATPAVTGGIAWWQRLRGERAYPSRDDIRVRDIPHLLKYMVLAKALDGAEDFLLSIVGDEVGRRYRAPIIHRRMSEIAADLPKSVDLWRPVYRRVALTGVPIAVVIAVGLEAGELNFSHAETVCLPFGPTGEAPDYIATFGQHTARSGLPRI